MTQSNFQRIQMIFWLFCFASTAAIASWLITPILGFVFVAAFCLLMAFASRECLHEAEKKERDAEKDS